MAQDTKFGTFGGVFTPSILTILGVIMYLRLPWVVGNGGLYVALGVIGVAHVVSICTGLSISSIATDKKVGAGGPYYIVSRSLGLPIGGTLGLALFVGLAFSISLYVIGFSESFLAYWGWEVTPTSIRTCGTIVMIVLTAVTLISTALAIKTQYLILTAIALSLVSIFAGSPPPLESAQLMPPAEGASVAVLFGIFFPAVTGFTAGVNMSGDLRDPKKSIPGGTIAAILVGLVVYVALAIFFSLRVPPAVLRNDPEVLLKMAYYAPLVVAGIWGATLSSALGSILGAPRILQAVASDKIGPRFFSKGYGPSHEPRNALLVAFAIGEAGILIAELDAIARIVSMVFLTTYGFLNLSCAIESWVSPDFRPSFRIPKMFSVVGAIACLLLMIQLDLLAMLGAIAGMGLVFFWLSRKQLTLDAGDAWEGIWSSLVRAGLYRLSGQAQQQRNWRPNILGFRPDARQDVRDRLHAVASTFISGNGIFTDVVLSDDMQRDPEDEPDERNVGVFTQQLATDDVYETITDVCRYHGFSGLTPNTVLLHWDGFRANEERFGNLLDDITALDLNLLVYAPAESDPERARRIDVWWSPAAGSVTLSTALIRFITRSREYADCELRFLVVSHDTAANDHMRATLRGVLTDARVDASIRIVNQGLRGSSFLDDVGRESRDAALTILGLPIDTDECGSATQARIDQLRRDMGSILLIRASSAFGEVLRLSRQATISFIPPRIDGQVELPALELPETADVAAVSATLADGYQRLVSRLHRACLARTYGREVKLLKRVRKIIERHYAALDKGLGGSNPRRLRNLVNRVQSALIHDLDQALESYEDKGLDAQRSALDTRLRAFLDNRLVVDRGERPPLLTIRRPRSDFEPDEDDSAYVRKLKRRKAFWNRRDIIRYDVPVAKLKAYYFERAVADLLRPALVQYVTDSHNLMLHLGKTLSSAQLSLAIPNGDDLPEEAALREAVASQREDLLLALDDLVDHTRERIGRHQWTLLGESRKLVQAFAVDLNRIDVVRTINKGRRIERKKARSLRSELEALPADWYQSQKLILGRAKLALALGSFQHRLGSVVNREKERMVLTLKSGALGECRAVLDTLRRTLTKLESGGDVKSFEMRADFDRRLDVEGVVASLTHATADLAGDLPAHERTLTDESIQLLSEGRRDRIERVEVPVQRLAQFLVEARLIGVLQDALESVPGAEARALGVAQDAVRLIAFQLSDPDEDEAERRALATQLADVVKSGVERLEVEVENLAQRVGEVVSTVDKQLSLVIDGCNAYDLTTTSADLAQHIRRHQGERAAAGALSVVRRARERMRKALVSLVYRRSEGVLMARDLRARAVGRDKLVDRMLALVEEHQPRAEVLDQLPFYYRQLFTGQATVNDTFWVGRERELRLAKRAINSFDRGASGAVVVTGERGAGKTSLVQRITTDLLGRRSLVRLAPPRSGSIDPEALREAFAEAAGLQGSLDDICRHLPEDAVVVIDDLELWWERSAGGMRTVDAIADLIAQHGGRTLFVLAVGAQAYTFISRFRSLGDDALALIECGPLPAEELKTIITLRHGSTGLAFELDGKDEDQLTELSLARLFSRHFDYARGQVGAALRSWVAHVSKVQSSTLVIAKPSVRDWDILDELRPTRTALLVQLVLHKALSRERLARVAGLEATEIEHDVATLVRMGLVTDTRHILSINPFVHHAVVARMQRRGLLAA